MKNISTGLLCVVVLTGCALTACSGGSESETKPAPAPLQTTKPTNNQPPKSNRVKAVQTSHNQPLVELQFELATRPELGKPLEIKLYLLGLSDASELQLSLTSKGKLALLSGAQVNFPALRIGETLTHSITVNSSSNDIYVIDAQLIATTEGHPRTLNFAIPIAFVPENPG
jgi:hypothetical protein